MGNPATPGASCNAGACDPDKIFTIDPVADPDNYAKFCDTDAALVPGSNPLRREHCVAPPLLCPGGDLYKSASSGVPVKAQAMSNIAFGLCQPSQDKLVGLGGVPTDEFVAPTYLCTNKIDVGSTGWTVCPVDLPGAAADWLRRWCARMTPPGGTCPIN